MSVCLGRYLKQAATTKMMPGMRLGMAEAIAGVVFLFPSSISSWNAVVLIDELNEMNTQ